MEETERFFGSVNGGRLVSSKCSKKLYVKVKEMSMDKNCFCISDNQFRSLSTFSSVILYEEDADIEEILEKLDEDGS